MPFKVILTFILPLLLFISCVYCTFDINTDPKCKYLNEHVLDLSETEMRRLKKPLIANDKIFCINLENNNISDIASETFGKVTNLGYLNLAGNLLSFDKLNFGAHPSIEILVLDQALKNSYINRRNIFKDLIHLEDSQIENVINFTPVIALPKLKKLYLRQNRITSVQSDVWLEEVFPNITHLFLSDNKISKVNFIKFIPSSLTHLYLNKNYIETFGDVSLNNLQVLNVDNNKINQLCGSTSQYCHGIILTSAIKLEALSVSHAGLQEIKSDAFLNLTKLNYLDISLNSLQEINNNTFDPLVNLSFLRLDHNRLKIIPNFQSLRNLSYLFLQNNAIESVSRSAFNGLSKLERLDLNDNRINDIHPEALHNLKSLKVLNLSRNKLIFLPSAWISSQMILHNLDLSHNLFHTFEGFSLTNATKLEDLNVSNNLFKSISVHTLMSLSKNINIEIGTTCIEKTKLGPFKKHENTEFIF